MVSATDLQHIESLEKEFLPIAGKDGGNFDSKKKYLELIRKQKLRRSETVARHGVDLLSDSKGRRALGKDLWTVYEQVAIATLDCGDLETAKICLQALQKKFPGSLRIARLEGLFLEASGRWDEALIFYSNLTLESPSDASPFKRNIAILKAQGKLGAAVDSLNKYLKLFMADFEAWRELADLYLKLQMYKQAAFCYEELILSAPTNAIFNLTYAEILYTLDGLENLKIARKYFAAAIEYSGGKNMRANFGLLLCSSATSKAQKGTRGQKEEKESNELPKLALKVVEKEYKRNGGTKLELVQNVLSKLAI